MPNPRPGLPLVEWVTVYDLKQDRQHIAAVQEATPPARVMA